jgi:predicted nucleotidyltransferase
MIYSEDYIRKLLNYALTRVTLPVNSGIIFEGSIAEGFGNAGSDIDFLIITPTDDERPLLPLIVFHEGKRIEVRYRSAEVLESQSRYFLSFLNKPEYKIADIPEDTLDRHQRFLNSLTLHDAPFIKSVKNIISYPDFGKIVSKWFAIRSRNRVRYAIALMALGESAVAKNWAQSGLIEAAKSWVATKGELYIFRKWIYHQFERVGAGEKTIKKFKSLYLDKDNDFTDNEYLDECMNMVRDFGIDDCYGDASNISIKRRKNITTWMLGNEVHVVREKKKVFLLKENAGRIWRTMLFEVPFPEVFSYIEANINANVKREYIGSIITKLQKIKLVDFLWKGKMTINIGNEFNIPPTTRLPLLSYKGITYCEKDGDIILSSIPAEQFAYSGVTLVYTNMIIENILEDFYGAMKNEQWSTCEDRLRIMIRQVCFLILCSYGVTPPPPLRNIMDDSIYSLINQPDVDPNFISEALSIEPIIINNKEDAQLNLKKIDNFIRRARDLVSANLFPNCFGSEDEWQKALDLAYDWVRMGAYVVSLFPVEEARDLLSTGGKQPHLAN